MPKTKLVKVDKSDLLKVQSMVNLLMQKSKPTSDLEQYYIQTNKHESTKHNLTKIVMLMTKRCLSCHRFKAATQLLEILSLESNSIDHFVFLAGLQVLENSHSSPEEFIFYFIRHVICLPNVHKREVLLEYLMFCLKNNIGAGNSNIGTLLSHFRKSFLRQNVIVDPILGAYLGIFSYLDWAKNARSQLQSTSFHSIAEKAIMSFKEVISLPGQWDIFVIKLLEILEFYKEYDEAMTVLNSYIEMNPDHINAYMYMFHFLHKYDKEPEQQIKFLKEILKRSPSDPHVFFLIELLKNKTNRIEKSLRYVFMFLDYPVHKNNFKAWKILTELIFEVTEYPDPTQFNVMTNCWERRASLWKRMYFRESNVEICTKECAKIVMLKAIVLYAFEEDHPFIQTVLQKLNNKYEKVSSRLKKKLHYLHKLKED